MDFLKKVNALVLGLAVLLAAGCGDDEKGSPSPGNATQANCKLTKHTTSLSATEYIYDNAGKLVRVNHTSSVSPESNSYELITYDADGNITAVKNMVHGYSKVLSYNSNNQPDTIYHFNGSVKSGFITCGYNAANQLVKWSSVSAHETVSSN
jgi:YD repeat-containing protein